MSHFTVLVVGDDPEAQLAPFQENNMGDCPEEYLAFHDTEDEFLKGYEESTEMVIFPDGSRLPKYDTRFYVKDNPDFLSPSRFVLPEGCRVEEVPFKEIYSTFEDYVEEYEGRQERDPKTGRYGYYENPNKKWDWYVLGGRWAGYFKLNEGAAGVAGDPSFMGSPAANGHADQALLKDIDFEGMMEDAAIEAEKCYDKVMVAFDGAIPKLDFEWKEVFEEKYPEVVGKSIEEKRKFFHEQPAMVRLWAVREAHKHDNDIAFMALEDFQCTREEYVQRARGNAIATFAVLKDGKWYERGTMGWWGIVSNEEDRNEWQNKFVELVRNLPPNTLLSVYDCHI